MKVLTTIVIFVFTFSSLTQTIEETATQFWSAVDNNEHSEVVKNGELLIDYIEENNFRLDSTSIALRIYIGISYSNLGDYKNGLKFNTDTYLSLKEYLGEENEFFVAILNMLAGNYYSLGEYEKSIELGYEALKIIEKIIGKQHHYYANTLNSIALNYSKIGNYTKSLDYNLEALFIIENTIGKMHRSYAMCLNDIAITYMVIGNYNKSIFYGLLSLEIIEKISGRNHPDYANTLNSIASIYHKIGNYTKSLDYHFQALDVLEITRGNKDPLYAFSLNNISSIYSDLGNYSKAFEFNIKALIIIEKALGNEHLDYAMILNNIATNYLDMGDYNKSLDYYLQGLDIRVKVLGKEHPDYATSLNNIAMNYLYMGYYTEALDYSFQALAVYEKTLGKEHPDYARSLNNIATNYSYMKNYNKTIEYQLKALAIREKTMGKEHPHYAVSLNNIAFNYSNMGNYEKSLEYNIEALEITEKALGKEHPSYATSLNNIAFNYLDLGDTLSAAKNLKQSYLIDVKSFRNNQFGLNTSLLSTYKNSLEKSFFLSTSLLSLNPTNSQFLANAWLNLNGLLASNQKNLEQELINSGDTAAIQLLEKLKLNKLQLNKYTELTIQENEKRGIDEKALQEDIDALERKLSQKSQSFANFNRYFCPSDVTNVLEENEYLVDISRIPYYSYYTNEWTDSVKYLVFISDGKDTLVDHFFIEIGNELENDLYTHYSSYSSGNDKKSEYNDELSYKYFWKPIADKIGDAKTVYVSLGGIYNNINLNTLYNTETGKYLLEEKNIHIVNSARDFVLMKERLAAENDKNTFYANNIAALFGYPNYDGSATPLVDSTDYLATTRDLSPYWVDSLTRGGVTATLLPGTKVEVENIGATLRDNNWTVTSYLENEASETNIKQMISPRVVHIATHGYFFGDIPEDKSQDRFMGMDRKKAVENPLLRSGLLFTGANKALQGEEIEGENGLLSAYEAALLDLRQTELVILSACETGKGEVQNSEGVYGLRKAIADAGAANTIMSLWKVDDKVTQEFMSAFYSTWLSGKTIREAFNETQLAIKAKYPQPYYWGAFVLVGE